MPVVKNKWGSPALTTGLVVQNLDPTTAIDVTVTCYDYTTGAASNCGQKIGLAARASAPFWMGSIFGTTVFSGSAVITTNPARPIATIVQESDAANALVYAANAPLSGSLTAYAPELYGSYAPSGPRWDSGLSLQNTSAATASITLHLYDSGGASVYTSSWSVAPYATKIVYPLPVAEGFIGSAWVSADRTIAVSATHVVSPASSNDDAWMAYLGVNR